VTLGEIVGDPCVLLHRVDPVHRQLHFRPAAPEAVRSAAFIDGRTDIWTGPPAVLGFAEAAGVQLTAAAPARAIFHMSFCGSTLLARLLDRPGKVLALKEPNCLVDLADWKRSGGAEFAPMLKFAAAMLDRPWAKGEQVLLKPSSWANNLIDDLAAFGRMRAVFVTIARDRFLEAVLRGGSERLAFAARLAAHLSPFVEGGPASVQAAIDSAPEPMGQVARLALVAHDLELRLFERAISGGSLTCAQIIDFAEIEEAPTEAASRAATALVLGLDDADLAANVEHWTRANAKADASFSAEQRCEENRQVRAAYGALIDESLGWAAGALGPATLQRG
jgi:hypothetical protein